MSTLAQLIQIGVVRCEVKDRQLMPTFGVPAMIEIFEPYSAGVRHLEKHSHVWILAWLHEADRERVLVTPRGVADTSEAAMHGVFAVRSPTRPNPIAMTVARIVSLQGNCLHVDRLDLIDGTPVIDLKPYFRSRDMIFSARNKQIGKPASRAAMLESLLYQAEQFHGERCAGVALGARVIEHWRSSYFDFAEVSGATAHVPEDAGCLIDAIMALVGATPGRATLQMHKGNAIVLIKDGARYEYALCEPERGQPSWRQMQFEHILALPDSALFHVSRHE